MAEPDHAAMAGDVDLPLAAILVFESHDVILAEVVAGLDFDHHAVDNTGIGQAVLRAGGDVGGLVGAHEYLLLAIDHPGHAGNHDPVFAAMVVHLQAEAGTRLDHDALHLEALAFLQHRVGAPGTMHGAMVAHAVVGGQLQLLHHGLDVLRPAAVGHQQGIGGIDDQQVVHAHGGYDAIAALHVAVGGSRPARPRR